MKKKMLQFFLFPSMRKQKAIICFLVGLALMIFVAPVLADYIGPQRTVSDPSACKVVLNECKWNEKKQDYTYKTTDSWSCQSESKPWKQYPDNRRNCNAANVGYEYWSRDEGESTTYPPATISSSVQGCTLQNGWCVSVPQLSLNAAEPVQGYAITYIEGTYNGQNFRCDQGSTSCTLSMNEGNNNFAFWAHSSFGDTTAMGNSGTKVDTNPPVIDNMINGTLGSNDWYTTPVAITANGSDTTSGLASAQVSINGDWQPSLILSDGIYTLESRAFDVAGNSATSTSTIKVDATPPTVLPILPGPNGLNDWFVSAPVNISVEGADSGSGLASAMVSVNGGAWQPNASLNDGIYNIDFRSVDNAGNMVTETRTVKVDTVNPTSLFSTPVNGSADTLVRGSYTLSGSSTDATAGVIGAEISLDGKNWLPLVISPDGSWSYTWDTTNWPDGIYPVVVRATDAAGNKELAASGARVTLLVNNQPPTIKLTPEWLIWESGSLLIKTDFFPIGEGAIIISDPEKRWPAVKIRFGKKYPKEIRWDRRFADGTLAPSGNYKVRVSACNIYDLCAKEKTATIKIPFYSIPVPITPVPTELVEVVQEINPVPTEIPVVSEPSAKAEVPAQVIESDPPQEIKATAKVGKVISISILPFVTLITLMMAISSASLADKRPKEIRAIAKTISQQR